MLCHKSFDISGVVLAGVVLFIFTDAAIRRNRRVGKYSDSLIKEPVPWFGVLTFGKEYKETINKVIPVTMISDKTGITDAKTMALLNKYNWESIKNHTFVMFLTQKKQAWYATVETYILHPEYIDETLTTIALLTLKYDSYNFKGYQLMWFNYSDPFSKRGQVLTIGYTNRNNILEQTIYQMENIKYSDCHRFYIEEELDSKWLRPKRYHCYRVRYSMASCVFEPGMALVYYAEGKFSLMGISAWGPGCSLPSRYIDFEPYVPWIMSKLAKRPTRRAWKMDEMDELELERKGRDRWILERITDEKGLVLRPLDPNTDGDMAKEVVHGKCDDSADDELIYREVTEFSDINPILNKSVLAVYALSLYDLNFDRFNYTCVQVLAKCKQKSDSQLEYTKGFGEHAHLDPYIKRIPIPHSSFMEDVYKPYIHTVKENWATYNYEILGSEITHLIFRFEFDTNAQFEVDFFGNRTEPTTESTTSTTTTTQTDETTSRKLRPYITVNVTTPEPDYYYDGWWYIKGPKTTTNGTTTTEKTTKTTNTAHWWNHWWHFNQEDHKEWWKG